MDHYHPADYTLPAGAPLANANFEASLRRCIYNALYDGVGGVVIIPVGRWDMTQKLTIPQAGTYCIGRGFSLRGVDSASSILDWSLSGLTGVLFEIDGTVETIAAPPGAVERSELPVPQHWVGEALYPTRFGYGDFRDFTIIGNNQIAGADAAHPQTGIRLLAVNQLRFSNVIVRMCRLGMLVDMIPDTNAQNCYFDNFTAANCTNGMQLVGSTQFTFTQLVCNQNLGSDIILGAVGVAGGGASILSGMFQSANAFPAITTVTPNMGGNSLYVANAYHEGIQTSFIKSTTPAVGTDSFHADTCVIGGFDTVFDLDTANLQVGQLIGNPGSKYARLRNCLTASFVQASDPLSSPSQWDVDTFSRAGLSVNGISSQYRGSSSDARSVTGLLTPFCADIFDPGVSSKRSVSAGKLVSLTGLVAGSTWAAPSAPRRPVFNTTSAAFNNRATFSCVAADQSILACALNVPVASGGMPGLFVVLKYTVPVTAVNNSSAIVLSSGHDITAQSLRLGYSDNTVAAGTLYTSHFVGGVANFNTASAVSDPTMAERHVALWCESTLYKPGVSIYQLYDNTDGETGHSGPTFAAANASMGNLFIGSSDTTSITYPSVEVAYVAVLKYGLPQGVVTQLMQMALERW